MNTDRAALIAWVKQESHSWKQQAKDDGVHERHSGMVYAERQHQHFDAIAALLEAEAWQPIETAPKDHSFILVFLPGNPRPVQSVQWAQSYEEDTVGFWATPFGPAGRGYTVLIDAPTHWRPLPAPPVTEADEVRCENCDQPIPDEGDRRVTTDDVTLCVDCWEGIDWTAPPVTEAKP